MTAGSSVVFSYALSFGNIVFARNKGICTWMLKFCKGFVFAFCFLNFVNMGLMQTNTFLHPFELLQLWESGIFERLGAKFC